MKDARSNSYFREEKPFWPLVFIALRLFFRMAVVCCDYSDKLRRLYVQIKSRLDRLFRIWWLDCLLRSVASITVITFFISSLPVERALAAGMPAVFTHASSSGAGSHNLLRNLNVETFSLPAYLGYVKDSWNSKSQNPKVPRTIIHIQDAHCNYAAQRKLPK